MVSKSGNGEASNVLQNVLIAGLGSASFDTLHVSFGLGCGTWTYHSALSLLKENFGKAALFRNFCKAGLRQKKPSFI